MPKVQNKELLMAQRRITRIKTIFELLYLLLENHIWFPPKRGWHTDRPKDICFYRVALLLKIIHICSIKK